MTPRAFPLRAVAALFLDRQHLAHPRRRRITAAALARFAEDTGGIQLDSINVVERAHYLTVWSRFGPYDRSALDRLVHRRRVLFEYWAHAACLIPTAHFPAWRRAMLDYNVRHRAWRDWLQKNRSMLRAVEGAIRERGPLANADFAQRRPAGTAAGWWNWKPTTHALDYLWMSGRTLVHSRNHFQKRFDLAERVMPDALAREPLARDAFRHWHLRQSLHAMGAATEADLRGYLTFPHFAPAERRGTLAAMLRSGEVVEVEVEPSRGRPARWLALAEDLAALAAAARRRTPARGTTLLAPFDSLLWHRDRVARLFGFDYRIEVYTPGHKRVHGYYSLPILHDGQLIGRLDAKIHRQEGRLEARHAHFEPWFAAGDPPPAASWGTPDREAALAGVAEAVHSLAAFAGASRVTLGRVSPARLRPLLARALRNAPAPPPMRSPTRATRAPALTGTRT
ncbi:MAG: hypothetical protein A2W00_08390 [Candidatus Eisenbacteria bacterium RBG_16_71_46]|nr:MAG: hypothetical protein A2W00_08390 [Candidatus Eisenbacteria bacterium RBG_16_71_46]